MRADFLIGRQELSKETGVLGGGPRCDLREKRSRRGGREGDLLCSLGSERKINRVRPVSGAKVLQPLGGVGQYRIFPVVGRRRDAPKALGVKGFEYLDASLDRSLWSALAALPKHLGQVSLSGVDLSDFERGIGLQNVER